MKTASAAAFLADGVHLPVSSWLIGALRTWQRWISPLLGSHCRFQPSCSAYAIEALTRFGAARGTRMAAARVLRCHPFHPGGVDPVPLR